MLAGITLTLAAVAVATALARDRVAALAQNYTMFDRARRASDAVAGMLLVGIGLMRVMQG
jgi:ABC-type nickel/cobalt efflux system permease component RcnA